MHIQDSFASISWKAWIRGTRTKVKWPFLNTEITLLIKVLNQS